MRCIVRVMGLMEVALLKESGSPESLNHGTVAF